MSAMRLTCAAVAVLLCCGVRGEAHKPFTSPYTFSEDVFPIVRERCGRCHVSGGVAPMSLMTYEEAVPWAQSLRLELMAGHMPPWSAETTAGRLRHSGGLTARELDVLLTWASGDTPAGDPRHVPPAVTLDRAWRLGRPDSIVPLPEVTLDAATHERTETLVVTPDLAGDAWLRAIDLQPGTAAIVRRATVSTRNGEVLAQWLPGDDPVPLPDGAAFRLPAGAPLVVTIHYRKTFAHDRSAMSDRSTVGLYLARGPAAAVASRVLPQGVTVLDAPLRVFAIAAAASQPDGRARIDITRPGGAPQTLIAFRAATRWARRYWFEEPLTLARGTRLFVDGGVDLVILGLPDE